MNLSDILSEECVRFDGLGPLGEHAPPDGRFSVNLEGGRFECLLMRKNEPLLFVLLSGAHDPARKALPKFDRWSWSERFPGSVLCISDPTLYLDPEMHIGWYVGTAEQDWLRSMASLVRCIAQSLDVPTPSIICYGSSAGGFGALTLAAELGTATAVAINPQTDVTRYSARFVRKLLQVAFNGKRVAGLVPAELERLSSIAAFRGASEAKCILVQNLQDEEHYRAHFTPFCEAFSVPVAGGSDSAGRINTIVFDAPNGHGAEPDELVPELVRRAVALTRLEPKTELAAARKTVEKARVEAKTERIIASQLYLIAGKGNQPIKGIPADFVFVLPGRGDLAEGRLSLPIDWAGDPFGDNNWCGQLHMWRIVDANLVQHDKTKDAGWLEFPVAIMRDWHRFIHVEKSHARFAWMDMMVGLRAMKLAYVISQADHGLLKIEADTRRMLDELVDSHLAFLLDHAKVAYSNHTFTDLHGAAALARVVTRQRKEAIQHFIGEVLPKLIAAQFNEHGVHLENSPGYQPFGIGCLKRLQKSGWFADFGLDALIARAQEVQDWFSMPDGRIVPLGDTDGAIQEKFSGAPVTRGRRQVFNCSGYAIIRDDGGDELLKSSYLAVMGALNSRFHKQSDDLSVIWFEGEDILCDAGKYAYKNDAYRAYVQSVRAHNTVEIDGQNYYDGNRIPAALIYGSAIGAVAVHEWGYQIDGTVQHVKFGVRHTRFLLYRPGEWLMVIDRLVGTEEHDFTQWFHFAPDLPDLGKHDDGYHTTLRSGRRLRVCGAGTAGITDTLEKGVTSPRLQGWISRGYRQVAENSALGFQQRGKEVLFATLLVLDDAGSTLALPAPYRLVLKAATSGKSETFRISVGEHSCRVKPDR
jgi:hypothetical protein